jgi:iron complex transport system substrate-binding protein
MVLTSRSVDEIEENLKKVSFITGADRQGEIVIKDMKDRLEAVRQKMEGLKKPRVVLITSRLSSGLFLVTRKGEYTSAIVELAGGILALEDGVKGPRVSQISPEVLLSIDPDIIILTRRRDEGTELYDYLEKPFFSELKAQREGEIYVVPSAEFLIPASRVVDGVERLSKIFINWNEKLKR